VARRVDGEHLYGKASPIAELLRPRGLLPVQRVDDTFLASAYAIAAVSFGLRSWPGAARPRCATRE
jgi:hypothetical protein